jgi:hypothetical protein
MIADSAISKEVCPHLTHVEAAILSFSASVARPAAVPRPFRARTRLTHGKGSTAEVSAVQGERLLRLVGITELDEPEAFGLACGVVDDDSCRVRSAELSEHLVELIVGGFVREIAYVNPHGIRPSCRRKIGEDTAGAELHILVNFRSGFVRRIWQRRAKREQNQHITNGETGPDVGSLLNRERGFIFSFYSGFA